MKWADMTTEQRTEFIKRHRHWTNKQMGQALGTTRNAIIGFRNRANLQVRTLRPNSAPPLETKPKRKPRPTKSVLTNHFVPGALPPTSRKPPLRPKGRGQRSWKPLIELEADDCRWPMWESDDNHRLFCAAPSTRGPYCEHHAKIGYAGFGSRQEI